MRGDQIIWDSLVLDQLQLKALFQYNSNGMIGDGTTTSRSTPTLISIPCVTPASVYMSLSISDVLTTTGSLFLWGENSQGQMGQGPLLVT